MKGGGVITLVSGLGAAQAVAIVTQIDAVGGAVGGSIFGAGPTAQLVLGLLSSVFLTVAITVTSVVVAGSTEVVLTGQLHEIALRRLLGASASAERRRAARTMMRRALIGMAWGTLAGYALSAIVIAAGLSSATGLHVTAGMFVPSPLLVLAMAAQLLATRAALRRGTRGVLSVQPVEALRVSASADLAVPVTLAARRTGAVVALAGGLALLGGALALSRSSPLAMLPAVLGGVLSFVGFVSCAEGVVPALLAGVGRVLPRTLAMTLAQRTLLRHPQRSSRAVLGVAATITLVTTFTVGIASFQRAVAQHYDGSAFAGLAGEVLTTVVSIVGVLTGFLAVTAAVALGNAVSFSTWLRRRDTALLRVLGQSARQTRATVLAQSLLLTVTATILGLALGSVYGWIGAQSVFGVEAPGHVVALVLPVALLVAVAAAVGLLTVVASVAPMRGALRRPPIRAYLAS